jgi:hypothetical protein
MIQYGHVNFDRIQITALKSTGNTVRLIMHYQIAKELGFPSTDYEFVIPKILGINSKISIFNRFVYLITLLYIKVRVSFDNYDKVIISNLDELTLGILPLCKGMYLFCHRNASDLDIFIKKYFMKRLSIKNKFIVFNEDMKVPFILNNISNLFVVSHGCNPPYESSADKLSIDIAKYDFVIFHPSAKIEGKFLEELKGNTKLHKFLKDRNYALVIRDKQAEISECDNIIVLHHYLDTEQYQAMFLVSNVILLVYPETFKYQVSGISYECFANGKNLLIYDNPSLKYCNGYYNYNPTFSTIEQLCKKIDYLHIHASATCVVNADMLKPDYSSILNDF